MRKVGSYNLSELNKRNSDDAIHKISAKLSSSENARKNEILKEPTWKCRYVVTFIGFLVLFSLSTNITIMGLMIVAMVNNTAVIQNSEMKSESCLDLLTNSSSDSPSYSPISNGEFIWSPATQGYILGCYWIGQVLMQVPASRLAERYGCKWILVGIHIANGIFTMLIPPSAYLSVTAVIVIQILRGLTQGMTTSVVTILMTNWCPKNERGFLNSITLTAYYLGPALGNIFEGYISELPGGWPYAFYIVGASGFLLALYIVFFFFETPTDHPRISIAELNFILSQQETKLSRRRPDFPWKQILTSVPVYAIIIGSFGRNWAFSQFLVVQSTFLGTILHLPMAKNGLFSATPFFLSFIISLIASAISGYIEKKEIVSVNLLRKFWVLLSSSLYSLCLLAIYLSGCNRELSVIFSTLTLGLESLASLGCPLVRQDMSPTFAGTLHSICNTFGYTSALILPLIVGHLTDEMQTIAQWNKVFFISIGVAMSTAIIFNVFGSAKIQPWNFVEETKGNEEKESESIKSDKVIRK